MPHAHVHVYVQAQALRDGPFYAVFFGSYEVSVAHSHAHARTHARTHDNHAKCQSTCSTAMLHNTHAMRLCKVSDHYLDSFTSMQTDVYTCTRANVHTHTNTHDRARCQSTY